jgi:hypothetical protein
MTVGSTDAKIPTLVGSAKALAPDQAQHCLRSTPLSQMGTLVHVLQGTCHGSWTQAQASEAPVARPGAVIVIHLAKTHTASRHHAAAWKQQSRTPGIIAATSQSLPAGNANVAK